MPQLDTEIAGVKLKNPVISASGTFGYGREYEVLCPPSMLGGVSTKGTTLKLREGNPPPRVVETASGMLNAVGLQNPGLDHFIRREIPYLKQAGTVVIANVAGATVEECAEIARRLEPTDVDMIELNISCPNVRQGGAAFGIHADSAAQITKAMRRATTKPLMVKLSPGVTDITEIAKAVESEGADAVSLINTLLGMRIDIRTKRPMLRNNVGGLSGPAIFPIALRMVWQAAQAVHIPVVGIGGISCAEDAIEMMMAGACAIQVGSAIFGQPDTPIRVIEGIDRFLQQQGVDCIQQIVGSVKPY